MKAPDRRASAVYLDTVLRTARVKKAGCQAAVDMIADAGDTRSGKARRRSRTPTTHWYHFHTSTTAAVQHAVGAAHRPPTGTTTSTQAPRQFSTPSEPHTDHPLVPLPHKHHRGSPARRRSRTPTTHWYHFHTSNAAVQHAVGAAHRPPTGTTTSTQAPPRQFSTPSEPHTDHPLVPLPHKHRGSTAAQCRQNQRKLFLGNAVVNLWNNLPVRTDFTGLSKLNRSLNNDCTAKTLQS